MAASSSIPEKTNSLTHYCASMMLEVWAGEFLADIYPDPIPNHVAVGFTTQSGAGEMPSLRWTNAKASAYRRGLTPARYTLQAGRISHAGRYALRRARLSTVDEDIVLYPSGAADT